MESKLVNSQLSNFKTYLMYRRQLTTLAQNVFIFDNLPKYIDLSFLNKRLFYDGSIAFFNDEVLGLLALPYTNMAKLDLYGRPQKIRVNGMNGYNKVIDNPNDFVIMYDNLSRQPLLLDTLQYAERLANITRTTDVNIAQQKTPRFWKVPNEYKKTISDLVNNVDGNIEQILGYENLDIRDISIICEPAPYVTDKLETEKEKIYNEFLRLIGVANQTVQKKERLITDEVQASQGGTIASRYNRFEPRRIACEQIKDKLGYDIKVKYYDSLPDQVKEIENNLESEVIEDDRI